MSDALTEIQGTESDRNVDNAPPTVPSISNPVESRAAALSEPVAHGPNSHVTLQLHATERSRIWSFWQNFYRLFLITLWDLKAYGVENVPNHGGVLIVANHHSFWDPIVVGVPLRRPVSYMAKSGLFNNPIFGWFIRNLHAFPVKQGTGDVGAMRETIRRLKEGHCLNIFPEGGRSRDGKIAPLQKGAAIVIRKLENKIPVIPAIIDGTYEAWPLHKKFPTPHPVRIVYGTPLQLEGLRAEEITKLISKTFHEMLADLRAGRTGPPNLSRNHPTSQTKSAPKKPRASR